jgi:cold shock CspA family protein
MATGTSTGVNVSKGHAFVAPDAGGPELFVEPARDRAQTPFLAGASVDFDPCEGAKGRIAATNVVVKKPLASEGGPSRAARSWS